MDVITGDYSPLSYLQATMAHRQLFTFGKSGHACSSKFDILLSLHSEYNESTEDYLTTYEWTTEEWCSVFVK